MKTVNVALVAMLFLAIMLPSGVYLLGNSPIRHKSDWLPVASFHALAEDGTPRLVPVRITRADAWTWSPDVTIGHVFVRRIPETHEVNALNAQHSHFGVGRCAYDHGKQCFRSRCWNVEFSLDGKLLDPRWSGLEDMRPYEAKVEAGEVLVRFPSGTNP